MRDPGQQHRLERPRARQHRLCRDLGISHFEWLVNLESLIGKGEFEFIGLPIKFKGGSGSPVRAVAILEE